MDGRPSPKESSRLNPLQLLVQDAPGVENQSEVEARPYGPESSEAERAALRNRVSVVEDRILLFRAVPVPTPFQLDLSFDRLEELTARFPMFALIIDLTEGERPNAEIRIHLRQRFSSLAGLVHASIFVGPSFVLTVAARFVLHGAGHSSVTFHRRYENALEAARHALAQ